MYSFNHKDVSEYCLDLWERHEWFASKPNEKECYSMMMPPPNVTGVLHLGHALNNTLQDILARYKRMNGYNVCWIPGLDHAGIAIQAVVEKKLAEEGRSKNDMSRELFENCCWEWVWAHYDKILDQLEEMGCSCDWRESIFTLSEQSANAVYAAFFHLFKDGLVYRGKRVVNWDTKLQTVISDDEVYHVNNRPYSSCTDTPVEEKLSEQWFIYMDAGLQGKHLANNAADVIRGRLVTFEPECYEQPCLEWLDKKQDWAVSRQLYWGHRLPIWSKKDPLLDMSCEMIDHIGRLEDEGRWWWNGPHVCLRDPINDREAIAILEKDGNWVRDPDVFDTWFSSALWPLTVSRWPEPSEKLAYYYPLDVLVTSRDILTLWVCRMIALCSYLHTAEWQGFGEVHQVPFAKVHVHAKFLDHKGQGMSKSKGNGIDPMEIIDKYGADALRFGVTWMATETQDVRVDRDLQPFKMGYKFYNKLANATKFVLMNLDGYKPKSTIEETLQDQDKTIIREFNQCLETVSKCIESFKFSEAIRTVDKFTRHEFCDVYIEQAKKSVQCSETRQATQQVLVHVLDGLVRMLHPIMPFITECIWYQMRNIGYQVESITEAPWPTPMKPKDA